MSKENPTQNELSAITQWQHGSYDINLPEWYEPGMVEPELTEYQQTATKGLPSPGESLPTVG